MHNSLILILILFFEISTAFTQDQFIEASQSIIDEIHIATQIQHINLIETQDISNTNLIVAIPKKLTNKRWRFLIVEKDLNYLMNVSNKMKTVKGQLYRKDILYGGAFEIGDNADIYGNVRVDRSNQMISIDHNHEFTLFNLDLGKLTIEPTIFQNINFFQIGTLHQNILVQPSSVGINFKHINSKDGQEIKLGISGGAGFDMMNKEMGIKSMWNLRVAVPLSSR